MAQERRPASIPNPEAKAWHGDGTAPERMWESSTQPHYTLPKTPEGCSLPGSSHTRTRILTPTHNNRKPNTNGTETPFIHTPNERESGPSYKDSGSSPTTALGPTTRTSQTGLSASIAVLDDAERRMHHVSYAKYAAEMTGYRRDTPLRRC